MKYLKLKPLPFVGAHPNCESMYILVSDGERFVPIARFFKSSVLDVCNGLLDVERRLAKRAERMERSVFGKTLGALRLRTLWLRITAALGVGRTLFKHARVGRFFKGAGPMKLYHMLALPLSLALGARTKTALGRHTAVESVLQIIILPFEDPSTLETERMERCPAAFAFYDPEKDQVKSVPVCAWGLHNVETMKRISKHYKTDQSHVALSRH